MARKVRIYGSLTDKQVAFAIKLVTEADAKNAAKAEREATLATAEPLAEGRYEVTGTVVSTKWQTSYTGYGDTLKMLVQTPDGNRVYGSVPKAIFGDTDPGIVVRFTAQVERSKDDDHFGFFKRPHRRHGGGVNRKEGTMTRKHFEAIAATVRDYLPAGPERDAFTVALASTLAGFNPRFDRDRFIEAVTGLGPPPPL